VPVPASFRAHAIERFNQGRNPSEVMRLVLVGVPGREIRIAATDRDMADAVAVLAAMDEPKPITRRVSVDGQPFLRTLHPSIANQPSCVSCHNAIQTGQPLWNLNEVMGAFALDAPLAPFLRKTRIEAVVIAVALFALACGIGFSIFRRQFGRMEEEIRSWTNRRLSDAVENLADGFAIYDSKGDLVLCNPAHRRNQDSDNVRRGTAQADTPLAAQEIALPNDTWLIVSENRTQFGDIVRIETDISALKKREEELRAAKEQAEKANRAKSNFLALMSHELRTPLNAINGFSEMMHKEILGPISARYREYACDINQSGEYLLSVINDILDMAKIEAGKVELVWGAVTVSEVVSGCIRLIEHRAARSQVTVTSHLLTDMTIMADEMRLKQVVLNLLTNAVKFTPAGGKVEVVAFLEDDGSPAIRVSDTGIGMSAAEIPRALAAFEQADSSVSRKFGGTGLGLPLSRRLVQLHGGALTIESKPGQGTSVTVRLPASVPVTPIAAAPRIAALMQ
jgi:signal transduction histidine kinase